jgi:hypothetical protein
VRLESFGVDLDAVRTVVAIADTGRLPAPVDSYLRHRGDPVE